MISEIINIIFWTGAISALFLIVLLLMSMIGSDIDMDMETDTDTGFGIFKSVMTFISMSCLTLYALYASTDLNDIWLVTISIVVGIVSILLLTLFVNWLLNNQEEGNWYLHQAINQEGYVYIPIPPNGLGKVILEIDGVEREIDAKSADMTAIPSRTKIIVTDIEKNYLLVMKYS